jgi:hypothetical protein
MKKFLGKELVVLKSSKICCLILFLIIFQ